MPIGLIDLRDLHARDIGTTTDSRVSPRDRSFAAVLSDGSPGPRPAAKAVQPGQLPASVSWRDFAQHALRTERSIDAMIADARRGKTFTAAELIAMQATVFRYSQTIEVISRAADRLVGSIKQTLGTSV